MLIKTGAIDHEFVRNFVLGFPEFKKMVMTFTPEKAAKITDVPVKTIYRLALEFSHGKPITLSAGFGMQRYTNSGQAMRAIISLMVLTGNIGEPGASWQFADLQSSIFDSIKDPFSYYPPDQPDGVARVSISTARLGQDMLSQQDPPIKMAWVERGNPVTQNPETHTVLKAFRSLDFRVVVEQFFTDTANEADIILPAKSMFEQSDVIGAYWHPYIQLKQKIMEPPGQVKPESDIYRLLAQYLDMPEDIINKYLPGPDDAQIDAYLEEKMAPFPELSLAELKKGPILAPGLQEIAFQDFVFPTPSGKIELYSKEAQLRWGADPLPVYFEAGESVQGETQLKEKYPLYMMTPNTKNRIHSQFNNLKMIRQFSPKPVLTLSPVDAEARQINHKDQVCVFNDRGSLDIEAHIDFSMKAGCVCITNGWWISEGGTVNFLSFGRETDMGHGAAFHDNLVDVKKI
jgi:anaerobic selenocysteine-containing dehydrogenase